MKRLRIREPEARITLYCRKGLGEFFIKTDLIDEAIEVDKDSKESLAFCRAALRSRHWDWIVCPHESLRTHALVRSLRAKRKTGYRNGWNFLVFNERIKRPMHLPEALRQLALVKGVDPVVRGGLASYGERMDLNKFPELASLDSRELALVPPWASMESPRIAALHAARRQPEVLDRLSEKSAQLAGQAGLVSQRGSGVAALAPGSVWATKRWTEEGYTDCARQLSLLGFRVMLIGSAGERELCERIRVAAGPMAVNVAGQTTIHESAELLALADVLICNDSGAMHMAAAAGVPVVAIFGPTTLALGYRPWMIAARVVQKKLACRPCGKHGAQRCPINTHECMKSIAASDVLHEVGEVLSRTRR